MCLFVLTAFTLFLVTCDVHASSLALNHAIIYTNLTPTPLNVSAMRPIAAAIALGFDADLAILDSDPAADITALARVAFTSGMEKSSSIAIVPQPQTGKSDRSSP